MNYNYKPVIWTVVRSLIILSCTVVQLIIQIVTNMPPLFSFIFFLLSSVMLIVTLYISLDLFLRDTVNWKGKVVGVKGRYFWLRVDGVVRKMKCRESDLEILKMDEEYELVLAKRSKILLDIRHVHQDTNEVMNAC